MDSFFDRFSLPITSSNGERQERAEFRAGKARGLALARGGFFLVNLVGYWGILPWLLVLGGKQIDRLLELPGLPVLLGLSLGSISVAVGVVASVWIAVVLYLRGGGFPIALMPPSRLVREGPYEVSRHPLYLAFTVYLFGWGAIAASIGMIAIVLPGFVLLWSLYALAHEEPVLVKRFGEAYRAYRCATPFFLRFSRTRSGPGMLFALIHLLGKAILRLLFPMIAKGAFFLLGIVLFVAAVAGSDLPANKAEQVRAGMTVAGAVFGLGIGIVSTLDLIPQGTPLSDSFLVIVPGTAAAAATSALAGRWVAEMALALRPTLAFSPLVGAGLGMIGGAFAGAVSFPFAMAIAIPVTEVSTGRFNYPQALEMSVLAGALWGGIAGVPAGAVAVPIISLYMGF